MILKRLSLSQYKNFKNQNFGFDSKINCLVGNNGKGKSNVLDAIYHLAMGKSYFNPISSQNINHQADFFRIEGDFLSNELEYKLEVLLKKGQKKVIKKNKKNYDRLSDHMGFIKVVMISPADRDLIIEGSDIRRKFINRVITQYQPTYINPIVKYQKILQQRNALLKYFQENRTFDASNLEVYNEQLCLYGNEIFKARNEFINEFTDIFESRYQTIAQIPEKVSLTYQSQLHKSSLEVLLHNSLPKDRMLQYTSVGIHKDDLLFQIDGHPIKKFGSQGQQKSFLIALKLAQFDYLKKQSHIPPILLLDDIFDKLDENRVSQIIKLVKDQHFGQIFISDTHSQRTENVVKEIHQSYKIISL